MAAGWGQITVRIKKMCQSIVRLKLDCTAKFPLRRGPVVFVVGLDESQHAVGIRQSVIQPESVIDRVQGLRDGFASRDVRDDRCQRINSRQSGKRRRVPRIQFSRPLKTRNGLLKTLRCTLVPSLQTLQVGVMSLWVQSCRRRQSLLDLLRERKPYLSCNQNGYVPLDLEHVVQFAIVALGPDVGLVRRLNELSGDSNVV